MKYLADKSEGAAMVASFRAQVEWAEYELAAAIYVAKALGVTYTDIGEAIGMTRQGVGQMARRGLQVTTLDDDEFDRIAKLLGAGDRVTRWEVRIALGNPKRGKVERRTLSTHLRREVAERKCDERGQDAELWELYPDGTRHLRTVRPVAQRVGWKGDSTASTFEDDF